MLLLDRRASAGRIRVNWRIEHDNKSSLCAYV